MNENNYFSTNQTTLTDFSEEKVSKYYAQGYVFTRLGKGVMNQTRSLRIDLSEFDLTSENRRVLNKNVDLELRMKDLPLEDYSWEIHKLGKEFYTQKFGDDTMSAAKIKEMFQEPERSNMNWVFSYKLGVSEIRNSSIEVPNKSEIINSKFEEGSQLKTTNYKLPAQGWSASGGKTSDVGYCLAYENSEILHYAYPFYDLEVPKERNLGMAMMLKAILWAKENNKKYIYLGSVVDEKAKYKLQFEGLEWWQNDKKIWSDDIEVLKELLITNF